MAPWSPRRAGWTWSRGLSGKFGVAGLPRVALGSLCRGEGGVLGRVFSGLCDLAAKRSGLVVIGAAAFNGHGVPPLLAVLGRGEGGMGGDELVEFRSGPLSDPGPGSA